MNENIWCSKFLCVTVLEENEYFAMSGKRSSEAASGVNDDAIYINGPQPTSNGSVESPEIVRIILSYLLYS